MARTIEDLDREYAGREEDSYYFYMQAVLGTKEEGARAWVAGEFKCIDWFDCRYCPAFNLEHCL